MFENCEYKLKIANKLENYNNTCLHVSIYLGK